MTDVLLNDALKSLGTWYVAASGTFPVASELFVDIPAGAMAFHMVMDTLHLLDSNGGDIAFQGYNASTPLGSPVDVASLNNGLPKYVNAVVWLNDSSFRSAFAGATRFRITPISGTLLAHPYTLLCINAPA